MAYAYWRGKSVYIAYKDEHSKEVQRSSAARTLTEGRKLAQELEAKCERIRLGLEQPEPEDVPYQEAVRMYLASLPVEYRSKAHLESRFRNRILPHLGKVLVRRMTAADVQRMLAANADASPQTREHLRVAVQGSYTWLVESAKLAAENPAAQVSKVRIPKRTPRFFRVEDVPRLLAAVPEEYRAAFSFAVGIGARKGEVFGLQWADVDLERRLVTLARSYDRDTTKGGRARTLPLPEWLVPMLREHAKGARSRWVFPGRDGRMRSKDTKVHLIIRTAMKAAGLVEGFDHRCVTRGARKGCGYEERRADNARGPCPKCGKPLWPKAVPLPLSFKDLRSTFGTWAYAHTGDIRFVQLMLGHQDVRVTEQRYSHVLDSHLHTRANQVQLGPGPVSQLQGKADETRRKLTRSSESEEPET